MKPDRVQRQVACVSSRNGLRGAVSTALDQAAILKRVSRDSRVALKPNFTYPYYKPGVTTSPDVIREVVEVLRDCTPHIAIVETGGGYGAWKAEEAFTGHGLQELQRKYGVEVVNLSDERSVEIEFTARGRRRSLPLPVRLLDDTDLLISMPVPKIHCMTGLTLAYKNQWGCIPDLMRLRRHYLFDAAIVAINQRLRPAVLADGTYFLDETGPMEGVAIRMDLIVAASDAGSFDRYVSELMGFEWTRVGHMRRAVAVGDMPASIEEISANVRPRDVSAHRFTLKRTARHWIALSGFHSRAVTWFGYESWFGRVVLHWLLYAIAGRPIKPKAPS